MAISSKNLLFGSAGVAALVGVAAVVDIFMGTPFAGQTLMDIMFIIGAAFVLAMAWDSFKEQV